MTNLACSLHHDRFAAEYLIDTNAAQAAMRAGYRAGTAKHQGAQLLAMPSERQSPFVREYLRDYNGKQAAIRSGYSPHSAE
jgi:phage terminase small subunit